MAEPPAPAIKQSSGHRGLLSHHGQDHGRTELRLGPDLLEQRSHFEGDDHAEGNGDEDQGQRGHPGQEPALIEELGHRQAPDGELAEGLCRRANMLPVSRSPVASLEGGRTRGGAGKTGIGRRPSGPAALVAGIRACRPRWREGARPLGRDVTHTRCRPRGGTRSSRCPWGADREGPGTPERVVTVRLCCLVPCWTPSARPCSQFEAVPEQRTDGTHLSVRPAGSRLARRSSGASASSRAPGRYLSVRTTCELGPMHPSTGAFLGEDKTVALQPSELSVLPDDVDLDRDRALVERCQSGDSAAFGELYARYYARVYRFCFRRLHDHEEAEDVAQDAFARAWRALPNFAGDRRFYPWLTVIADNRCRDIQRRRARSTPTADVDLVARQATEPTGTDDPRGRADRVGGGRPGPSGPRTPVGPPSGRPQAAGGVGLDLPGDRQTRGCRDQDGREPDLAGPAGPEAGVRHHRQREHGHRWFRSGAVGRTSASGRFGGAAAASGRSRAGHHRGGTRPGRRRRPDVIRICRRGDARRRPARGSPGDCSGAHCSCRAPRRAGSGRRGGPGRPGCSSLARGRWARTRCHTDDGRRAGHTCRPAGTGAGHSLHHSDSHGRQSGCNGRSRASRARWDHPDNDGAGLDQWRQPARGRRIEPHWRPRASTGFPIGGRPTERPRGHRPARPTRIHPDHRADPGAPRWQLTPRARCER